MSNSTATPAPAAATPASVRSTAVVTDCGLVTSLGHGVIASCAAARAGVVRSSAVDWCRFVSDVDGDPEAAVCHAVRDLTYGFEGLARQIRLVSAALRDLRESSASAPERSAKSRVYMSVPHPARTEMGRALLANSPTEGDGPRFDDPATIAAVTEFWNARLADELGPGRKPELAFVALSGRTGFAEALRRALSDLDERRVERALVGGVDSMLDDDTLVWLQHTRRLKHSGNPVGLQPGEAAGFLVLTSQDFARRNGVAARASARYVTTEDEVGSRFDGSHATGRALSTVLERAVPLSVQRAQDPWWSINDANGENFAAMEWGHALSRMLAGGAHGGDCVAWTPAASFGEVGSAFGAVAACMAIRAFERGYAPTSSAVISACSDGRRRAAFVVANTSN